MTVSSKRESILLFLGDIAILVFSLWLALFLRYGGNLNFDRFWFHFVPFSLLIVAWVGVFFIAGLYEKHTVILKSRLPSIIFNAQIVNSILAVIFFYFVPYFGITPKTNLFIYLAISFVLMLLWRIYGYSILGLKKKQNAILIGSGEEMKELMLEVNNNSLYDLYFVSSIDLDNADGVDFQDEILKRIYSEDIKVIAADLRNEKVGPILPSLYNLIFSHVRFIDMYKIYEDIFDRVPLSLVKYSWFLENISISRKFVYDFLKRLVDIVLSAVFGIVSLIFYPFIIVAIKIDDKGKAFFAQDRIGKNNSIIRIVKFRSMSRKDGGEKVTSVGKFLRRTRLDELPQLWNVFKGDISLIGPRPEMPVLAELYEKEIPYYNVRHLIKPGLSGWAQLYQDTPPKFSAKLSETKTKLSYDLYYIKNRSIMLDMKIILKTLKTLVSRSGI